MYFFRQLRLFFNLRVDIKQFKQEQEPVFPVFSLGAGIALIEAGQPFATTGIFPEFLPSQPGGPKK